MRDKNSQNWTEDDIPCVKPLFMHKFPKRFLNMLSVELSEIQISNLGVLNLKCINKHISSTFNIFCPKSILTSQLEIPVGHRKPTKIAKAFLNMYSLQQTTITWHKLCLAINSTFCTSFYPFFRGVRPHGNVFFNPNRNVVSQQQRGRPRSQFSQQLPPFSSLQMFVA